jgi:hypothetical protein
MVQGGRFWKMRRLAERTETNGFEERRCRGAARDAINLQGEGQAAIRWVMCKRNGYENLRKRQWMGYQFGKIAAESWRGGVGMGGRVKRPGLWLRLRQCKRKRSGPSPQTLGGGYRRCHAPAIAAAAAAASLIFAIEERRCIRGISCCQRGQGKAEGFAGAWLSGSGQYTGCPGIVRNSSGV